jgi:hypothetical protein
VFGMTARKDRTSKKGGQKINIEGMTTERVRNDEAMRKLRDAYEAQQLK